MENNSFTKKSYQKLKSSYITSRTFDKLEKIEKVDKIPNQVDSVNLATRLIRGELEIRLTHTQIYILDQDLVPDLILRLLRIFSSNKCSD